MTFLYLANDINKPSHLWMRRMLDALGSERARLVTEAPLGAYAGRYRAARIPTGWENYFWRAYRKAGYVQRLPATRRSVAWLRGQLAECQGALVHYLTVAVKYEAVWRRTPKPVYVHCHGYDVTWDLQRPGVGEGPGHDSTYVERVLRLPESVRFIANSHSTSNRLTSIGISPERIFIKYLGVPVESQPPTRRTVAGSTGAEIRKGSHPPGKSRPVTILYLGRLVDFKGPLEVIAAFERAVELGLSGQLWIAGDGPLESACEAARAASPVKDQITLFGAVDEAQGIQLRSQADIFTAHNRRGEVTGQEEAFGVSCVEAMAAGLPVVSGRNGSLPEILQSEVEGLLVEPGDVEAHAQAFVRLAEDPILRRTMGQNGWRRACRDYSLGREQARLREILGIVDSAPEATAASVGVD